MNRVGRRFKRFSDSKIVDLRKKDRRVTDADDDDTLDGEADPEELKNLTPEEIDGLLELLPYKDALIKIAKGEFEIEKVEEVEEDTDADADAEGAEAEEENFEEDEDLNAEAEEDTEDDEDYEEYEEEDTVEDSASNNDAWAKRLQGNDN